VQRDGYNFMYCIIGYYSYSVQFSIVDPQNLSFVGSFVHQPSSLLLQPSLALIQLPHPRTRSW
jgi:hypothetical protein